MWDWHQTLRNITETTRHPFDAQREEMKQNSQNMYGFYKTPKNFPNKMESFKEM